MKGFFKTLKAIFLVGFIAVFILGVISFLLKLVFIDISGIFLKPLIILWWSDGWWVYPLTGVLTLVIIMVIGSPLYFVVKLQKTINKALEWLSPKGEMAILLNINDGVDYFAFKIKEFSQKKIDGTILIRYVLFAPYSPIPGSGLPIIVADKEKVTPLNITMRQLISIIMSFGRNVPDVLEELNNQSAE